MSNLLQSQQQGAPSAESQFAGVSSFKEAGLPWRVLLFASFLFGLTLFIYLGMRFGYETYLNTRSKNIDKEIEQLGSQVKSKEQEDFVRFYSQVVNLEKVLGRHKFVSNITPFLEKNTLRSIYFTNADFSLKDNKLSLGGKARSVEDLVGQFSVFEAASEVRSVSLDNVSLSGLETGFGATVIFKDSFFDKPQ